MKLLQKIKYKDNNIIIETVIEYDDGTRHPKLGTLLLENGYFLECKEWKYIEELFRDKPDGMHLIVDLGKIK